MIKTNQPPRFPGRFRSTARDVIKAGVPLLTHPGRSMISRMGASVNMAMGLSHLVAENSEAFRGLVVKIAAGAGLATFERSSVWKKVGKFRHNVRGSAGSFSLGLLSLADKGN